MNSPQHEAAHFKKLVCGQEAAHVIHDHSKSILHTFYIKMHIFKSN